MRGIGMIPHNSLFFAISGEERKMKKSMILVLVVAFLAFSICIGSVGAVHAKGKVLKIGTILNLTGPIAFMGPLFKNGMIFALEEFNYEVGGRKIELIPKDAANDMNVALEAAKRLVERDGVHIILGPLMGDAQLAVGPYLGGKGVLATGLYAGMIPLVQNYGNWLMYPSTTIGLTLPVGYYAHDMGYKTMVTGGADYAGGHGFIKGIKIAFEEKGGKVVDQVWWPVGTTDFGPYMSKFENADSLGWFVEGPSAAMRFLKQYHQFGVKTQIIGAVMDSCVPVHVLNQLGKVSTDLNLKGQAAYFTGRKDPVNDKWVKAMTKRFGQEPSSTENNGYCIMKSILLALKKTGGDDSFKKLWPAVLDVEFDSPQGPLAWGPQGVAELNGYIVGVERAPSGKYYWEPIKTYQRVVDPRLKK
jgi:branched-chain amino acid transport system substrate-binding protein